MKYFSPRTLGIMKARRKKADAITGSNSCKCMAGHIHDSRKEAGYCSELQLRQRAGEPFIFERQVTFRLDVNGWHICSHRVDFLLEYPDGSKEVHEVKGFINESWPIKKKLFEATRPEIKYVVVMK